MNSSPNNCEDCEGSGFVIASIKGRSRLEFCACDFGKLCRKAWDDRCKLCDGIGQRRRGQKPEDYYCFVWCTCEKGIRLKTEASCPHCRGKGIRQLDKHRSDWCVCAVGVRERKSAEDYARSPQGKKSAAGLCLAKGCNRKAFGRDCMYCSECLNHSHEKGFKVESREPEAQ